MKNYLILFLSLTLFCSAAPADEEADLERAQTALEQAMLRAQEAREQAQEAREQAQEATRRAREATREMSKMQREQGIDHMHKKRAVIGVVLAPDPEQGVGIAALSPDSSAEQAGIEIGDRIVAINGVELNHVKRPRERLSSAHDLIGPLFEGDAVALTIDRDGELIQFDLIASRRDHNLAAMVPRILDDLDFQIDLSDMPSPEDIESFKDYWHEEAEKFGDMGRDLGRRLELEQLAELGYDWLSDSPLQQLEMAAMNPGLEPYFATASGVLVLQVPEENPLNLKTGDVILEIGGREVSQPQHAMRILRSYEKEESVGLTIMRNGHRRSINGLLAGLFGG